MKQQIDFDIVVVGGGIVGLASAYKIIMHHPGISIAVLEKEEQVAAHQTGRNSGVIHSGLYYESGSNKAKTCTQGRNELIAFAKEHNVPCKICGKIIVATKVRQLPYLEHLFNNGVANGVEGIKKIDPDEIEKIEPACDGITAIHVPSAGVIDFTEVAKKLAELIETSSGGSKILTSHKVLAFDKHDFFTKVITNKGSLNAKYIINCAGLHSDRVAMMDTLQPAVKIVPFRGDYYQLTDQAAEKVNALIYPVPDPAFPFLGIHFTRKIDGSVECGPNAVFSFKKEGYRKTDFSLTDSWDALSYPGLWKLFLRHWKFGFAEYARAFSKKLFLRQLQMLLPTLSPDDIIPADSGVRAQAVAPNGLLVDDFIVEKRANAIHILNAPSPAATASLAIGDYINQLATKSFSLND